MHELLLVVDTSIYLSRVVHNAHRHRVNQDADYKPDVATCKIAVTKRRKSLGADPARSLAI